MQTSLWSTSSNDGPMRKPIDAALEIGAYEALWSEKNASFKTIAERFRRDPEARPSDFVPEDVARETGRRVLRTLRAAVHHFDVRVHGDVDYPQRLRDATHPIELLYVQGDWGLASRRGVAVVGTRKPTEQGIARAQALARHLVEDGFVVISGLAEGIDTAAHRAAIAADGKTIAVIGTPLNRQYPKSNADLQAQIARDHLLVSQVPVERYAAQPPTVNRMFFPERNKTMSAMSEATVIVEAGETSGTLVQAREALKQGRKVLILNNLFERDDISWPRRFEDQGAVRVRDYAEIRRELDR